MTSEERYRILEALSETILPASEDGPGAAEAKVAGYLERALARRSARDRARIENGLELVDSMARQCHGKPFGDCDGEERSDVLKQLGRVPHRIVRGFFSTLVGLVIEGFLCDPAHGGNHAGAGWLAVGYSPELPR
jgi:gluconate 2-dehydrogenase gamma chain